MLCQETGNPNPNSKNKYTMDFLLNLYEEEEMNDIDFRGKKITKLRNS